MTHSPPVADNLPINTLVAGQKPTIIIDNIHTIKTALDDTHTSASSAQVSTISVFIMSSEAS